MFDRTPPHYLFDTHTQIVLLIVLTDKTIKITMTCLFPVSETYLGSDTTALDADSSPPPGD